MKVHYGLRYPPQPASLTAAGFVDRSKPLHQPVITACHDRADLPPYVCFVAVASLAVGRLTVARHTRRLFSNAQAEDRDGIAERLSAEPVGFQPATLAHARMKA